MTIKAFKHQESNDLKNYQEKKHNDINFLIDIPNVKLYFIKSNLPLLLLLIIPSKFYFFIFYLIH